MSHTHMQLTGEIKIEHTQVLPLLAALAAIGEPYENLEAYLVANFAQRHYEDEWQSETKYQDDGTTITLQPEITYDCGMIQSLLYLDDAFEILTRHSTGDLELHHLDDFDWTYRDPRW